MKTASRKQLERRFSALATKEALGTINAHELAKLERYSSLRYPKRSSAEMVNDTRQHWEVTQACKALKRLIRRFEDLKP